MLPGATGHIQRIALSGCSPTKQAQAHTAFFSLLLLGGLPALQRRVGLLTLLAAHVGHADARGAAAKASRVNLCGCGAHAALPCRAHGGQFTVNMSEPRVKDLLWLLAAAPQGLPP